MDHLSGDRHAILLAGRRLRGCAERRQGRHLDTARLQLSLAVPPFRKWPTCGQRQRKHLTSGRRQCQVLLPWSQSLWASCAGLRGVSGYVPPYVLWNASIEPQLALSLSLSLSLSLVVSLPPLRIEDVAVHTSETCLTLQFIAARAQALENKEPRAATIKVTSNRARTYHVRKCESWCKAA